MTVLHGGGDPQPEDADQLVDRTGAAGPGEDDDRLVVAADRAVDDRAGVLAQPCRLQARATGLGVGVGISRQHLAADEVLDEGQRAAGRRVVGVGHPTGTVGPRHNLVLADDRLADPADDGGFRWLQRSHSPRLGLDDVPRIHPRSGPDREGSDRRRQLRRQRRAGPAGRAARLPPGLVRRAPQHADHRLVGHERADRARRRAHRADPARRRRRHAAQPRAADDRRAVRHAGDAASRADRPRPRPRAGLGPEHHVCAAPRPDERRHLPAGRARAAGLPDRRHPRCRASTRRPARAPTCRSTSSARRCSARSWPPRSGLPYAFASHFAPAALHEAVAAYRAEFRPSAQSRCAVRHRRRQRHRRGHRARRPSEQFQVAKRARIRALTSRAAGASPTRRPTSCSPPPAGSRSPR